MQRRLTDTEIDDLVAQYQAGVTIDVLAEELGLNRTTVMDHLERRGVFRRSPRELIDLVACHANCEALAPPSGPVADRLPSDP